MRAKRLVLVSVVAVGLVISSRASAGDVLKVPFDTTTNDRGVGAGKTLPLDNIDVGTVGFYPQSVWPTGCAAWVDPSAGLNGSAKGLRLTRTDDTSDGLYVTLETATPRDPFPQNPPPYWVDYRFKIDPDLSSDTPDLMYVYLKQCLGTSEACQQGDQVIWQTLIGEEAGKLKYQLNSPNAGNPYVLLGDADSSTEWRVVMLIDPSADKQTHWVFRDGVQVINPNLGKPWDLLNPQSNVLRYLQFEGRGNADLEATIDEVRVSSEGPPLLKAVPSNVGHITLSWVGNAESAVGYRVQRSSDAQSWTQLQQDFHANTFSYDDATATQKQRYYYRVGAVLPGNDVVWSTTAYAFGVYTGGPLSDWVDVTTDPRIDTTDCPLATPNDGTDDTCGLQQALNLLNYASHPDDPRVLYFPNGTYRVSDTLILEGGTGPELIGQSAGNVVIQWVGSPGSKNANTGVVSPQVMFWAEAPYHLVVSNLVFDGARTSTTENYVVGFDLSACPSAPRPPSDPSYDECDGRENNWYKISGELGVIDSGTGIFDSTFRNSWVGLRISHYNFQDSELSVRRSQFLDNEFGTSVEDFNALQLHFWDCKWDNNRARGITNYIKNFGGTYDPPPSADWSGDFTVTRGRFSNNGQDIYYIPGGQFQVRDSWSRGSGMFIFGYGQTTSYTQFTVSNNYVDDLNPSRILDDYDSMTSPPPYRPFVGVDLQRGRAIANQNAGALVMVDNKFDAPDPLYLIPVEPIFANTSFPAFSAILALSNRYAASAPYEATNVQAKVTSIDDQVGQSDLNLTIPPLPTPVDILAGHAVFTVTDAANAQDVIDAAAAAAQSGPVVVHFPTNEYLLSSTLEIPAVSNELVITGSGTSTQLFWYGDGTGPMMRVSGFQASTTVRDLTFNATNGGSRADGLVIEDVNAVDTRVFMNRVGTYRPKPIGSPATGGIDVDRADLTMIDVFDLNATGYRSANPYNYEDFLMRVTAGPQSQAVKSLWSSSAGGAKKNFIGVGGPQGLKWLIAGSYMEHSQFFLDVSGPDGGGAGSVSVVGAKIATDRNLETQAVYVDNFTGNVSVVASELQDIDPNTVGIGSTLRPTGAIIKQSGSAPLDIESMGNAFTADLGYKILGAAQFTRASDKQKVCAEPWRYDGDDDQELVRGSCFGLSPDPDAPGSDPNGSYALGVAHDVGETTADFADSHDPLTQADIDRVYAGLELYRTTPVPGYYDEPGARATYQVNIDNVKVWEPITGIRVNGGIPVDPTALQSNVVSATQIDLSWQDNSSNEDGFKVWRATSAGGAGTQLSPNPGVGVTTFSDSTAPEAGQYYYRVAAHRDTTGDSGVVSGGATYTPPHTPTNPSAAQNGTTAILVAWTDNSSAETNFDLQRSTSASGPFTTVATPAANSTSYNNNSGLTEGTQYWYKVASRKTFSGPVHAYSPYAGAVSAATKLNAPTNLAGTPMNGRDNKLTWTDQSGVETGFEVQRAEKTGSPATCGTYASINSAPAKTGTGGTVTYHDIGFLTNPPLAAVTYCYRVRAVNAVSASDWVGPVSVKTKP